MNSIVENVGAGALFVLWILFLVWIIRCIFRVVSAATRPPKWLGLFVLLLPLTVSCNDNDRCHVSPIPSPIVGHCKATNCDDCDLDRSGRVDSDDLTLFVNKSIDVNKDGTTDTCDENAIAIHFGEHCDDD